MTPDDRTAGPCSGGCTTIVREGQDVSHVTDRHADLLIDDDEALVAKQDVDLASDDRDSTQSNVTVVGFKRHASRQSSRRLGIAKR